MKSAILGGWSQTAVVTRTFISSPQAKATVDGRRVFDGYFPGQAAVGSSGGSQVGRVPDIGVPIVELEGERELLVTISVYGSLGYRRPDSKTYRLYEVAAMSHINNEPDNPVSGFAGSLDCDWPAGATPSAFRQTDIWAMAFDNLVRWISRGVAPPRAARIELEADGRTVSATPTRTRSAGCAASSSTSRRRASCRRASHRAAWSGTRAPTRATSSTSARTRLQQLYRTHARLRAAGHQGHQQLVRERFLLRRSARDLVATAEQANVPD